MMLARGVEHDGYDRRSEYGDNSDGAERAITQGSVEAEDNEQSDDEPGVGLGLPGLASLTLPSEDMVVPPLNFAMVSEGIFRSGYPIACNFPFLRQLGLRSILCLCPLHPGSLQWANEAGVRIEMCELGENSPPFVSMPLAAMTAAVDFLSAGTPELEDREVYGRGRWAPAVDNINHFVSVSPEDTHNSRNRPILVHCLKGRTQTGCAIGCLRRRQNWSLGAIFDEYLRFAGDSATPLDMQFIELFE